MTFENSYCFTPGGKELVHRIHRWIVTNNNYYEQSDTGHCHRKIQVETNASAVGKKTIKEVKTCSRGVSSCLGYQSTTLSNGSIERYDGFE